MSRSDPGMLRGVSSPQLPCHPVRSGACQMRAGRVMVGAVVASMVLGGGAVSAQGQAAAATPLATTPAATTPPQALGAWSAPTSAPLPGAEYVTLIPAGAKATLASIGSFKAGGSYAPITEDGKLGKVVKPKREIVRSPVFDRRGRGIVAVKVGKRDFGWATMRPDGATGAVHRLGQPLDGVEIAMNPAGDLVIAWLDRNTPSRERESGLGRYRVRVAIRPAGKAFRKTETLPIEPTEGNQDGFGPALTAAVGPGGRLVVAVAVTPVISRNGITAWTGTSRTGLGARQGIGSHASNTYLSSVVTKGGGAVVAWGTQSQGEEISSGYRVRAAALAPGARRFGATRELDPGGLKEQRGDRVALVADPRGGAILAWDNDRSADVRDVSMATVSGRGRISARRALATNAGGARLAVSPAGATAIAYGQEGGTRVLYRAPGTARFAAPEPVPAAVDSLFGDLFFWPSGRLGIVGLSGDVSDPTVVPNLVATSRKR